MSQTKIRTALEKRILAYATAHSIPVAWENSGGEFESSYLAVFVFPSPTLNPSLGVKHRRYRGILRIQVHMPTEINGTFELESLAADVVELFPRGLEIIEDGLSVNIEDTPSQSRVYPDGNFIYTVVETSYRCETY